MRSSTDYFDVISLLSRGLSDSEVSRACRVPRSTVREWRRRPRTAEPTIRPASCDACGCDHQDFRALPGPSYAYLLGMYLGDGCIDQLPRTWRRGIFMDMRWQGIIRECAGAMRAVLPHNRVSVYQAHRHSRCAVAMIHSKQLVCLLPHHPGGAKHSHPIVLPNWQRSFVRDHLKEFLRELIHSDGCRFMNTIRTDKKTYTYPRYNFTNRSEDIRSLFTSTCDRIGIAWRRMNAHNISVAKQEAVARLDEFVGPRT